ncbi:MULTISPECIES: hypothetical protein [unclassified Streptomyces]|uniref:MFS transporter n=1 Tax=Streptomyces sp. NBC_00060 TaxID=2975636 RepID=A0AAU2GTU3_9ACTN
MILGLGLPTVAAWADGSHFPSASSAFGFFGGAAVGVLVGAAVVIPLTARWASGEDPGTEA